MLGVDLDISLWTVCSVCVETRCFDMVPTIAKLRQLRHKKPHLSDVKAGPVNAHANSSRNFIC